MLLNYCVAMGIYCGQKSLKYLYKISSNHRLESAGLNALEELWFKMLGMGRLREDSNAYLACKRNWIRCKPFY